MAQDSEATTDDMPSAYWQRYLAPLAKYHLLAAALFLGIFIFDITPRGFGYIIPLLLAFFHTPRTAYRYAAVGSFLWLGSVLLRTPDAVTFTFLMHRGVAVISLFLTAALISARLQREEALRTAVQMERDLRDRQRSFVSILSHEVRSPLTVVDGQARRLIKLSAAGSLSGEDLERRATKIRQGARQMVELVERFLDFAAIEDGDIKPNMAPLSIGELLTVTCRRFGKQHPDRAFRLTSTDLPPSVDGDLRMLSSVFDNLLSNAVKFSCPEAPIDIHAETTADAIVVSVRDYGIGIPAAALPKLFTAYFRAPNTEGIRGTGIGLHVSRRFVAMHGGTIAVESNLGQGTRLILSLPIGPERTSP